MDTRPYKKAIIRERIRMTTTEEIAYDMSGSVRFSQLDLNKAFHQLELADEESKDITTIETSLGPLRFEVLQMGQANASEILTNVIKVKVLHNLKGVKNLADNIIVYGKTVEEHDANLLKVVQRLKESGLTISRANCTLGVEKIVFFGLDISKDGIKVHDDKIRALKEAGPCANASEVLSFLGLAVYCATHIPNLAELAAPLWDLTKESSKVFEWKDVHNEALLKIKEAIIIKALSFFKKSWLTEVTVDASPRGFAAVLAQVNPKNKKEKVVITFISRKISKIEDRYAQVEKEGAAVVWACERLYLYLEFNHFTLITDNRAIELIMSNPRSNPPLRIKRWALRMMRFDYTIIHKPGASNIADYMSRHPDELEEITNLGEVDDSYINWITNHLVPKSMTKEELIEHTNKDDSLQCLKQILNDSVNLSNSELIKAVKVKFSKVLNELMVTADGLVLRGERIVLPESLQARAVSIAHEGHQGMTKVKGFLRTKIWFPNMDIMVKEKMESCLVCQVMDTSSQVQPNLSTPLPERAWEFLAMDFFGPIPTGQELCVLIDEYSRYPIVFDVPTTASATLLPKLEEVFSTMGIPVEMKTDNGPPFNGSAFEEFCESFGIVHRPITPEHAQANGLAEGFMKNLARVIKTAEIERKHWKEALVTFLRAYRSTPHSSTGVAPSQLLFGANRTSRLPASIKESKSRKEFKQMAVENDKNAKLKVSIANDKKLHAKQHQIKEGDVVLARQKRLNKFMTRYSTDQNIVKQVKGPMITVETPEGKVYTRNADKFKPDYRANFVLPNKLELGNVTTPRPPVIVEPVVLRKSDRIRVPIQRLGIN